MPPEISHLLNNKKTTGKWIIMIMHIKNKASTLLTERADEMEWHSEAAWFISDYICIYLMRHNLKQTGKNTWIKENHSKID